MPTQNNNIIVHGVDKKHSDDDLSRIIKKVLLESTNNLEWLKNGETVFLKPALNSADPYPATTHYLSLKAVAEELRQRGAKVICGDQSGMEHVVRDSNGVVKGSSRECFEKSGMSRCGVDFIAFEKEEWDDFLLLRPELAKSWDNGFYIYNIIEKVDHIINLPRISAHSSAGATLGYKCLVGLLRDDSRLEFHSDGYFGGIIKKTAQKSDLKTNYPNQDRFFKKIVEISLAIRTKLRLTLFTGTKVLTTLGPDLKVAPLMHSKIFTPQNGLIIGSSNQAAAEAMALAFLTVLYKKTSFARRLPEKLLILLNKKINEFGAKSIWQNPFIQYGLELGLGDRNFETKYINVPDSLTSELEKIINNDGKAN